MTFSLVSSTTGTPLKGIEVKSGYNEQYLETLGVTGNDGYCRVQIPYVRNIRGPIISFEDPQGQYEVKDTTLADLRERTVLIKMNPAQ